MSWELGLPRNSVPCGRGEEERGCLAFSFSIDKARITGASVIRRPFKETRQRQISPPLFHPGNLSFLVCQLLRSVDVSGME